KDNQGKSGHVIGLLFVTLGLEFLSLSVLALESVAMRGLFGAVATNRHAAPSSRPSPRVVREDQRAAMSLARLRVGEVFFAHELRQRLADRQQQGFRGSPAPHHSQFQATAIAVVMSRYLAVRFVTLQEPIQGTQFVERLGPERPARMLSNEASEPLPQR